MLRVQSENHSENEYIKSIRFLPSGSELWRAAALLYDHPRLSAEDEGSGGEATCCQTLISTRRAMQHRLSCSPHTQPADQQQSGAGEALRGAAAPLKS